MRAASQTFAPHPHTQTALYSVSWIYNGCKMMACRKSVCVTHWGRLSDRVPVGKSHGADLQAWVSLQTNLAHQRQPGNVSFMRGHWVGINLLLDFLFQSLFNSCNKRHTNSKGIFNNRFATRSNCPLFWRSKVPRFLKFVVFPAACHNFSQPLPISALSPFFQNASLASRAPVVFFALLFSKAALYDKPESSEGALETN